MNKQSYELLGTENIKFIFMKFLIHLISDNTHSLN